MLTQECLNKWTTYFACKISTRATEYYRELNIGSNCASKSLFQLELAVALIDQICDLEVEDLGCVEKEQVCKIIDNLKILLKSKTCNCK